MSTVSLIILNYNGKHFLGPCLASIDRQTRPPDELILVDNGSEDGSQSWIQKNYPNANLIEMGYNSGFSVAMNRGVAESKSDYVALLNNDTECEPQWLDALVDALDTHAEIGFCASRMLYFDNRNLINTTGTTLTVAGIVGMRGWLHRASGAYGEKDRVFGSCAGAAIYRRSIYEKMGGFDEDFITYHEDADLDFRLQLAGYPCLYVPEAVIYHHVGGTWKTTGQSNAQRLGQRNQILLLIKNLPVKLWLRLCIPIIAGHTCLFLMRIRRGYGFASLLGLLGVIGQLRTTLIKRKHVQESRCVSNAYLISIMDSNWFSSLFEPYIQKRKMKRMSH